MRKALRAVCAGAALAALAGTVILAHAHGTSEHERSAPSSGAAAQLGTSDVSVSTPAVVDGKPQLPALPFADRAAVAKHGMVFLTPPAGAAQRALPLEKAEALAISYVQPGSTAIAASLVVTSDPGSDVDDHCFCWIVKIQMAHPIAPQDACLGCAGARATPSTQPVRHVLVYVDAVSGRFVEAVYGGGVS